MPTNPNRKQSPSSSKKSTPANKEDVDIATRNLGLIAGRVFRFWRSLPTSVQHFYDAEDMIQDVVLHVFQVSQKYDAAKAKESTWIQHITDNKCLSILSYYQTQSRAACETISLDDFITTDSGQTVLSKYDDANRWRQSQSTQEIREAKEAVEKVIELGSDSVRDFLEKLLSGGLIEEVPAYSLQALAKRCSATLKDFELVFRYASGV